MKNDETVSWGEVRQVIRALNATLDAVQAMLAPQAGRRDLFSEFSELFGAGVATAATAATAATTDTK